MSIYVNERERERERVLDKYVHMVPYSSFISFIYSSDK
jgi:hypothetical protein